MVIYDNFPSDPKLNNGNINDSSQTDLSSRCWPAARGTSWRSSSSSTPSSPTRLAGSPSPRRSGRAEFRKIMPRRKPVIQFADVYPPGYPGFPSPVPFLNPVPKSQIPAIGEHLRTSNGYSDIRCPADIRELWEFQLRS